MSNRLTEGKNICPGSFGHVVMYREVTERFRNHYIRNYSSSPLLYASYLNCVCRERRDAMSNKNIKALVHEED